MRCERCRGLQLTAVGTILTILFHGRACRTFTITREIAETALDHFNAEMLARCTSDVMRYQVDKKSVRSTTDIGLLRATGMIKALAALRRVRNAALTARSGGSTDRDPLDSARRGSVGPLSAIGELPLLLGVTLTEHARLSTTHCTPPVCQRRTPLQVCLVRCLVQI